MRKEKEKWMGGRFLGKRREKMLGLRLVLSRAIWKDKDHLGEGQREWKGEMAGRGGTWRRTEEKLEDPWENGGGTLQGWKNRKKEVDGGGRAALREKYGHI